MSSSSSSSLLLSPPSSPLSSTSSYKKDEKRQRHHDADDDDGDGGTRPKIDSGPMKRKYPESMIYTSTSSGDTSTENENGAIGRKLDADDPEYQPDSSSAEDPDDFHFVPDYHTDPSETDSVPTDDTSTDDDKDPSYRPSGWTAGWRPKRKYRRRTLRKTVTNNRRCTTLTGDNKPRRVPPTGPSRAEQRPSDVVGWGTSLRSDTAWRIVGDSRSGEVERVKTAPFPSADRPSVGRVTRTGAGPRLVYVGSTDGSNLLVDIDGLEQPEPAD